VSKSEVLRSALSVQTTSKDNTLSEELRKKLSRGDSLRQVNGSHSISAGLRLRSQLFQTHSLDSSLNNLNRDLLVLLKPSLHIIGELAQRGVKSTNQLRRRSRKVRRLLCLIVLHDRNPVLERSEVGARSNSTVVESIHSTSGHHHDAQTSGDSNSLLGGGQNDIDAPVGELDLLTSDRADTVDNDEGGGGNLLNGGGDGLDVGKDSGGGVDVGDGDDLVVLLLESGLDLGDAGTGTDGGLKLGRDSSVGGDTVGEGVGEVSWNWRLISGIRTVGI
jgi:hypothetical protein